MASLKVLLIGPLPPPSGGMANQTRQLANLLRAEGVIVEVVQSNAPYVPKWIASAWGVRALFRFLPYLWRLWRATGTVHVVHVMANSGLVWYLVVAPAVYIARLRGVPVVVNYRGGLAAEFLAKRSRSVLATLRRAQRLVVPSQFLQVVFGRYGAEAHIVPNSVDIDVFSPADTKTPSLGGPHVIVTRNLEAIYGIDTAIRAVALLSKSFPDVRLSIAGSGIERVKLERLAMELGIDHLVTFTGRLETTEMVRLYRSADVVLNPSRVDNTPNSILEALATGVPVVSTNVGGVPYLVQHGRSAWLVPPDDPQKMAEGMERVLRDEALRIDLRAAGLEVARACSWSEVKQQWLAMYREAVRAVKTYTALCSRILFPLQERLKAHTSVAMRRDLERTQWFDPSALRKLQTERLRSFMVYVAENNPYFRDSFARIGFDAHDVRSPEDLRRLPLLTKEIIRANIDRLKSTPAKRLIRYNTGGSTGEPLVFYMGPDRVSHDVAAKWRATRWWGVDIGDPEVVLWGSPVELGKQDRLKALRDWLFRSYLLPAFAMSEAKMRTYVRDIARIKPRMLFGYASALALLARFAEAESIDMRGLDIKSRFHHRRESVSRAARGDRKNLQHQGCQRLWSPRRRLYRPSMSTRLVA